jgi:hypothetical protein
MEYILAVLSEIDFKAIKMEYGTEDMHLGEIQRKKCR